MGDAFPKRSRIEGTKQNILRIHLQHLRVRSWLGQTQSRQIYTFQEMTWLYSRMSVTVVFKLDLEPDALYRMPI
jgi:hypothetical protein